MYCLHFLHLQSLIQKPSALLDDDAFEHLALPRINIATQKGIP